MWVVFRKSDRKVIGTTAHSSSRELDKEFALAEVVKWRVKDAKTEDFDAIQVRDPERVRALLSLDARQEVLLEEDPDGELLPRIRTPERFFLRVTTNAQAFHPVDGVALIPADNKSAVEISIQKVDEQDRPVARAADNDELWLRTDYGTLHDLSGNLVHKLRLSRGEAAFRLQSGASPRLAAVRIFNADFDLDDAFVRVEFTPSVTAAGTSSAFAAAAPAPIEELAFPDDYQQDLRRAVEILRGYDSEEVYLLGSAATGEVGEETTVDLAVRGYAKGKLTEIRKRLADALERPVDVVDLDGNTAFARHLRSVEGELLRIG